MHTGKSIKLVAVMAAATLFCAGCADKAAQTINDISTDAVTDEAQSPEDISAPSSDETTVKTIDEIYQEIEQTVSLYSPQCMDAEFISNYYGIDVTTLEEYVFSMSEDAAQAETVIIMKVKDAGELESFAECLQTVADDKKSEMQDYIPEQYAIVEKSKVQTRDNYVWLIISENADAISDVIESGLF